MNAENEPQNLPKPQLDSHLQPTKKTKCPMASPRKRGISRTPLQSKSIPVSKQTTNEEAGYFGKPLTPVGGKKFYSVLDISDSPTPRNDPAFGTGDTLEVGKRKRNEKISVERSSSLFKETKNSDSKRGIMWLIWIILEWIGALFVKYTSPTPIPEATKSKFLNRRTKSNRNREDLYASHSKLGFTPAVRRPKPPL